ncbi:MAG: DUF1800 family protein [Pseudomonadota bacterium]|nr:DUF1800 family protein [Pseudomonadota bacterium]
MARATAKWSTAFSRFGLGALGKAEPRAGDPRDALAAELAAPGAGALAGPELKSGVEAMTTFVELAAERAQAQKTPAAPKPSPIAAIFKQEATARIEAACAAEIGFVERLVAFWSNHFCISAAKGLSVRALAGAYEREAIRPHVLGRFVDMLQAVERHPAMLVYLDNVQSIGPNSRQGQRAKKGLNENFGREILELHTLGVDGGYAQSDVGELARTLTGWTVAGRDGKLGLPGGFAFNANAHEGGTRTLLQTRYEQEGVAQGEAALADLARAPATARHIAAKFARAFVADAPPAGLVARLTDVFLQTDGDLGALARALIADEDAWSAPATKMRDPWQMMIASWRALGLDPSQPNRILSSMTLLGMPLWSPGGPNGFPDAADAWASPEGIKTRVQVAAGLGRIAKDAPAPRELLARVLPDAADMTRETVLHAETRAQAYALMILSPDFQRR